MDPEDSDAALDVKPPEQTETQPPQVTDVICGNTTNVYQCNHDLSDPENPNPNLINTLQVAVSRVRGTDGCETTIASRLSLGTQTGMSIVVDIKHIKRKKAVRHNHRVTGLVRKVDLALQVGDPEVMPERKYEKWRMWAIMVATMVLTVIIIVLSLLANRKK